MYGIRIVRSEDFFVLCFMTTISKLEDLIVWQKSRKLAIEIFETISRKEYNRNFALKDQMHRSSGSIVDNIAEGQGRRGNREFANFLHYSLGSMNELRSQIHRSFDYKFISEQEHIYLLTELKDLEVRINNLLKSIRKSNFQARKK